MNEWMWNMRYAELVPYMVWHTLHCNHIPLPNEKTFLKLSIITIVQNGDWNEKIKSIKCYERKRLVPSIDVKIGHWYVWHWDWVQIENFQ